MRAVLHVNTILQAIVIALCLWMGNAVVDVRERVARIEGQLIYSTRKGITMLDINTVGAGHSPGAYCDRETGKPVTTQPPVIFSAHRFYETADHQLGHDMDGRQRAVIPPEGWDDYALTWPACAGLVAALRKKAK